MKTLIGVYKSHDDAIKALYILKEKGFAVANISIVGKADLVGGHIHVKENENVEVSEVGMGIVAGIALGILTGVGVFVIPGFGFLYGAGALVGAMAGAEAGFLGGGIIGALTNMMGVDEANALRYEKHLNEGRFLLYAPGGKKEIEQVKKILDTQDLSIELDTH